MDNIFNIGAPRKILVANQNCFPIPIKHPSRLLNEHIISYVLQGGWEVKIGEETIKPKKDYVFIQPANIIHQGISFCPPNTTTMFVHFSVADGDHLSDTPVLSKNQLFIGNLIDASLSPQIKDFMVKIIEENANGNHIKASCYLNLLLCELSECFNNQKTDYAQSIKKIIDQNINKNLKNTDIAKMLNISVRTAEYSFNKIYKTTIHKYMLKQKLKQAKFWLEYYPNVKITKISNDLGFYDEYHFSRHFKKETGYSPKQYRENILKTKNIP